MCNNHNLCPTGPSDLKVATTKSIVNLSIVIQWDEVDDSLTTTYIVTWTSERDHVKVINLIEQSSYTITGLTLDTVYTISVIATNMCGTGPEYRTSVSFPTGMCHHHYLLTICSNPTITMTAYPMAVAFITNVTGLLKAD